ASPGHVADQSRLGQRLAFEIGEQLLACLLLGHVRATEDQTITDAMLQRNAPLPAGRARGRTRVRCDAMRRGSLHRERAVGRQPLAPILVARLERLFDEQAAKARAIDEQIAFDARAVFHDERGHVAGFAVLLDARDLAFDALDALRFILAAQELGIQTGVEMERIVHRYFFVELELAGLGRLVLETVLAELAAEPQGFRHQPHVVKAAHPRGPADVAEGVDVAIAEARPILELDAELERRLRRANELELVEAEQRMEAANRGDRRFADADGADVLGLDERNVDDRAQL